MNPATGGDHLAISWRSRFGLNCANFLQAESAGVVMPVVLVFLADAHWRYSTIGLVTAIGMALLFVWEARLKWSRIKRV